jgi:hypothetical protein
LGDEKNASGGTLKNRTQVQLEHKYSLDHYLKITEPREFLSIFPEAVNYGEVVSSILPYFLARIAISSGLDYKILWGLDTIFTLLQDENRVRDLERYCHFTYLDLLRLAHECDPFNLQQVAERERTVEKLNDEVSGKEQIIETLASHLKATEAQAQDFFTRFVETQKELEEIKNSRSWRYTAFLRQIWGKLH